MLAKNLRSPRGIRHPASSLATIASMLAPTGLPIVHTGQATYSPNPSLRTISDLLRSIIPSALTAPATRRLGLIRLPRHRRARVQRRRRPTHR